ncbi:MAG: hypothetical protein PHC34_12265 [Candidatus Gastranaerophilales bacterium]|nr:hypothetical protein [Candidatus Gastranaerophilales bacterium]
MKNLSGYTYFMVTAKLLFRGFQFRSEISSDIEEWINPDTCKIFIIKKSFDFYSEEELFDIIEQAGISVKEFINI